MARLHWFRKDLRLNDNEALAECVAAAVNDGDREVTALYVFNMSEFTALSAIRQHSLRAGVSALADSLSSLGGELNVQQASGGLAGLVSAVVRLAQAAKAKEVHAMRLYDPAGVVEQNAVGVALQAVGIFLRLSGSNYAVAPGSVLKASDGLPYRVYTPFYKAWVEHLPVGSASAPKPLPQLGQNWRSSKVAQLAPSQGLPECTQAAPFRVIAGAPIFSNMRYDTGELAETRLAAWQSGKTGYPMVDAGMRQLLADGWVHNRVRMIVASFLVKDLHLEWQQGAAWFERHLSDFDPASNAHGWQWTAGTGTDASPYYRVFNPVMQGLKFDPKGDYVRKYVPELRHLEGASAHEPWSVADGHALGYAERIVDHSIERQDSLVRLEELKALR